MEIRETAKFWVFGFQSMDFPSKDGGRSWQRGTGKIYVDKLEWAAVARFHGWGSAKPTDQDSEYGQLGYRLFEICVPARYMHA